MAYIQPQDIEPTSAKEDSFQFHDPITKSGVAPPLSKTIIYTISPRDYQNLRENIESQSNESVLEGNTSTEIDMLDQVGLKTGHSRMLTPEEFDVIYKSADGVPSDIPLEQWIILRKTTFPYSVLSNEEREAIQAAIAKIIEHSMFLSLDVLTIYIVLRYLKGKQKDRPNIVLVSSGGGDVALDGNIDKRSGGLYLDSSESGRFRSVNPEDIEAYDVLLDPPESGNIKKVAVIIDAESGKWIGFPHSLHYFSSVAGFQLLDLLSETINEDEVARLMHLIATAGNPSFLNRSRVLSNLDRYDNDQLVSIYADILGELGNYKAIKRLAGLLDDQDQSARVKQIAATALLQIGTVRSTSELFRRLRSFDASPLILETLAENINDSAVREIINSGGEITNRTRSRIVNLFKFVPPHKLVPPIYADIRANTDPKAQILIINILEDLYKSGWVDGTDLLLQFASIMSEFTWSPLARSSQVSIEALFALREVILGSRGTFSSQKKIQLLSPALNSIASEVRCTTVGFILEIGGRQVLTQIRTVIENENDDETRKCMKRHLKVWHQRNRNTVSARFFDFITRRQNEAQVSSDYQEEFKIPRFLAYSIAVFISPAFFKTLFIILALSAIGFGVAYLMLPGAFKTNNILERISDDFHEPNSELWGISSESDTIWQGYIDEQIAMEVKESGITDVILLNKEPFTDFELSVDANVIDDSLDNLFGVYFNYQNTDTYYYFAISSDGLIWLLEKSLGKWTTLYRLEKSAIVDPQNNKIDISYKRGHLVVKVNSIEVVDLRALESLGAGKIGLAAGTTHEGDNTFVSFDNFRLLIFDK